MRPLSTKTDYTDLLFNIALPREPSPGDFRNYSRERSIVQAPSPSVFLLYVSDLNSFLFVYSLDASRD